MLYSVLIERGEVPIERGEVPDLSFLLLTFCSSTVTKGIWLMCSKVAPVRHLAHVQCHAN